MWHTCVTPAPPRGGRLGSRDIASPGDRPAHAGPVVGGSQCAFACWHRVVWVCSRAGWSSARWRCHWKVVIGLDTELQPCRRAPCLGPRPVPGLRLVLVRDALTYEINERNRQGRRGASTALCELVAAIRWLALWSRPAGTTWCVHCHRCFLLGSSGSLVAPGDFLSWAFPTAVCRAFPCPL